MRLRAPALVLALLLASSPLAAKHRRPKPMTCGAKLLCRNRRRPRARLEIIRVDDRELANEA